MYSKMFNILFVLLTIISLIYGGIFPQENKSLKRFKRQHGWHHGGWHHRGWHHGGWYRPHYYHHWNPYWGHHHGPWW